MLGPSPVVAGHPEREHLEPPAVGRRPARCGAGQPLGQGDSAHGRTHGSRREEETDDQRSHQGGLVSGDAARAMPRPSGWQGSGCNLLCCFIVLSTRTCHGSLQAGMLRKTEFDSVQERIGFSELVSTFHMRLAGRHGWSAPTQAACLSVAHVRRGAIRLPWLAAS